MSAYKDRLTIEALELATELADLLTIYNNAAIVNVPPQCGKPGNGFKYHRKHLHLIRTARVNLQTFDQRLVLWLNTDRVSAAYRQRRAIWFAQLATRI